MHDYKGKSKCPCGKRAKYRAYTPLHRPVFACNDHKGQLEAFADNIEEQDLTEADHQTWLRL